MSSLTLEKKRLGAFYTPSEATKILCQWAIRAKTDTILEPSFGGCGFLQASITRLKGLGDDCPHSRLYGCDIDNKAFSFLESTVGPIPIEGRFIKEDFLKLTPQSFGQDGFDVVIGNPPYIRHHDMSSEQRITAKTVANEIDGLTKNVSLWGYFLLHSLRFLRQNARMAWVLPSSFLYAAYSHPIKERLRLFFRRVLVVSLSERLFLTEGTDESTVIVLCEGYMEATPQSYIEFGHAESLVELQDLLATWEEKVWRGTNLGDRCNVSLLSPEAHHIYSTVRGSGDAVEIGKIADVSIGIVTGANHFFVINRSSAVANSLTTTSLKPILSKFRMTSGMVLTTDDVTASILADERCLLVDTATMTEGSAVQEYVNSFPLEDISKNKTFKKRKTWHQPNDGRRPDAFFPYMHHSGPRLVLNGAGVTSTNTVHRVFFKGLSHSERKAVAISLLSTFSQLSSEIEGRCYGSGVLKHEPNEARKISILLPRCWSSSEIESRFSKVDSFLRRGLLAGAQKEANDFVMAAGLFDVEACKKLEKDLYCLRSKRQRTR